MRAAFLVTSVLVGLHLSSGISAAATLHVSPSGSGSSCSAVAPCGSFASAYSVAQPGDVVQVAGGTYPAQSIPALTKSGTTPIEFRAALGATVSMPDMAVAADNVVIDGVQATDVFAIDAGCAGDWAENVTVRNSSASYNWVQSVRGYTWQGGDIGPRHNEKTAMMSGCQLNEDVMWDGVYFHDATRDSADVHMECLFANAVDGLTVRNSRFHNCAVMDVMLTTCCPGPEPDNVTIENNVFEYPRDLNGTGSAYFTFLVHGQINDLDNLVIRNNVFESPYVWDPGDVDSGRVVGNVVEGGWNGSCHDGVTYAYNVTTTVKCAPTDTIDVNVFSSLNSDWTPEAGSSVIDAGSPTDFPPTDKAGNLRTAPADAGAYEYGGTPPDPTPTPTPTPTPDTTPPSVPQGMAWTGTSTTTLSLRWDPSTDNVGVVGYRLYKNGALHDTTTDTTYTFTGLTCGTSYTVALTAFDAAGNESSASEATGSNTTDPCPLTLRVGSASLEPTADFSSEGEAEAFKYTAGSSGTVTQLRIYNPAGAPATTLELALYASTANGANPGALKGKCSVQSPATAAWVSCSIPATSVTSGTSYWLSVLAPEGNGGEARFLDHCCGAGSATVRGSASTSLTTHPTTWATGWGGRNDGPASFAGLG